MALVFLIHCIDFKSCHKKLGEKKRNIEHLLENHQMLL